MREPDRQKILELLSRLETLEQRQVAPEEQAVSLIAQQAIMEEISKLVRSDWLSVYRKGNSLDVVSMF